MPSKGSIPEEKSPETQIPISSRPLFSILKNLSDENLQRFQHGERIQKIIT
jgi:hypothetical protein